MRDKINKQVKHREDFRPFAPAITKEDVDKYFNGIQSSPYMLFVVNVNNAAKQEIPSVVHVNGTSRVQTVEKESNPRFYELLRAFEKIKGVPVLLNTSFNVNQEPMVNSPVDAIRCFFGTGLDYLVMGNYLVKKK